MVMGTKEIGDCFEIHGKFMLDQMFHGTGDRYTLVHGMVHGQGDVAGYRFAHSWIEIGESILDISNGGFVKMSIEKYYELGKISDVHKYTIEDVMSKVNQHEHWGCWDFVGAVEKV